MTAYEQRSYPGGAADTLLSADIASGATSFSVTAGTGSGYPDGSSGPFFVIIDYDNSKAEKIRCSGRVNDTFTVAGTGGGRGQDGTSAQAHTANGKVRAVITATDIQEANRAAAQTIGRVTSKGDLTPGASANTTARLAVGGDATLLAADSTQPGGVKWTGTIQPVSVQAAFFGSLNGTHAFFSDGTSNPSALIRPAGAGLIGLAVKAQASQTGDLQQWQDNAGTSLAKVDKDGNVSAPNLTGSWSSVGVTLSNVTAGTATLRYLVTGKTVQYAVSVSAGTVTSGSAAITFTLPFSWSAVGTQSVISAQASQPYVFAGQVGGTAFTLLAANSLATGLSLVGVRANGSFEIV